MRQSRHQSSTAPSVTRTPLSMSASSRKSSPRPSVRQSASTTWMHPRHRMPTSRHLSLTRPSGRQRRHPITWLMTSSSVGLERCGGQLTITSRGGVKVHPLFPILAWIHPRWPGSILAQGCCIARKMQQHQQEVPQPSTTS